MNSANNNEPIMHKPAFQKKARKILKTRKNLSYKIIFFVSPMFIGHPVLKTKLAKFLINFEIPPILRASLLNNTRL